MVRRTAQQIAEDKAQQALDLRIRTAFFDAVGISIEDRVAYDNLGTYAMIRDMFNLLVYGPDAARKAWRREAEVFFADYDDKLAAFNGNLQEATDQWHLDRLQLRKDRKHPLDFSWVESDKERGFDPMNVTAWNYVEKAIEDEDRVRQLGEALKLYAKAAVEDGLVVEGSLLPYYEKKATTLFLKALGLEYTGPTLRTHQHIDRLMSSLEIRIDMVASNLSLSKSTVRQLKDDAPFISSRKNADAPAVRFADGLRPHMEAALATGKNLPDGYTVNKALINDVQRATANMASIRFLEKAGLEHTATGAGKIRIGADVGDMINKVISSLEITAEEVGEALAPLIQQRIADGYPLPKHIVAKEISQEAASEPAIDFRAKLNATRQRSKGNEIS